MRTSRRPWLWGILIFVITLVAMIFVAAPVQYLWGMWGLAVTEIMLLAIAVVSALLLRCDLREVFPFHVPKARQVVGTILLVIAGFVINMALLMVVLFIFLQIFPWAYNSVEAISSLATSTPVGITWLIMALMPAICEEALHRGIIRHTFSCFKSKWPTVLWMALIFGIFHLDPVRFLNTALLGGILTYVMLETHNLWLPILFHLINNSISVLSTLVDTGETAVDAVDFQAMLGPATVGIYVVFSSFAVLLLWGGAALVKRPVEPTPEARAARKRSYIVMGVVAGVVFIAGVVMVAVGAGDFIEYAMSLYEGEIW